MRFRSALVLLPVVLVLGSAACKKVDPAEQKKLLASDDPKKRDEAARELKTLYAKDPTSLGDLGAQVWTARVKNLPNDEAEQKALLKTPFPPGSISDFRLDDFWAVTVRRDSTLKITAATGPTRNVAYVDVKPPAGFTGAWTTYYVHGNPYHTDDYVGGKLKHTREMYETGTLHRDAEMVDGPKPGALVPNGTVITRYPNGKPEIEELYDRGVLNGVRKQFYPSGKLKQEGPYVAGALDGFLVNYREDGSYEWCIVYDKGREVDRRCPPKK